MSTIKYSAWQSLLNAFCVLALLFLWARTGVDKTLLSTICQILLHNTVTFTYVNFCTVHNNRKDNTVNFVLCDTIFSLHRSSILFSKPLTYYDERESAFSRSPIKKFGSPEPIFNKHYKMQVTPTKFHQNRKIHVGNMIKIYLYP
jgi:hypothetical protein